MTVARDGYCQVLGLEYIILLMNKVGNMTMATCTCIMVTFGELQDATGLGPSPKVNYVTEAREPNAETIRWCERRVSKVTEMMQQRRTTTETKQTEDGKG